MWASRKRLVRLGGRWPLREADPCTEPRRKGGQRTFKEFYSCAPVRNSLQVCSRQTEASSGMPLATRLPGRCRGRPKSRASPGVNDAREPGSTAGSRARLHTQLRCQWQLWRRPRQPVQRRMQAMQAVLRGRGQPPV